MVFTTNRYGFVSYWGFDVFLSNFARTGASVVKIGCAPSPFRRRSLAVVAALVSSSMLLGGCSSAPDMSDAASAGQAVTKSSAPSTLSAGSATPGPSATKQAVSTKGTGPSPDATTGTVGPPLPNPVAKVTKVARPGQPSMPSVTAPPAPFSGPVTYSDGVKLVIVQATKRVETGNGPGVFNGRPFVKFDIELLNGSREPINLNAVVITTFYGTQKQLAPPVYTPSAATNDFSGTVAPGAKATASFGFAVPVADLGSVTMVVDFDGVHTSATYTGTVAAS